MPGLPESAASDELSPLVRLLAAFDTHVESETDTIAGYRQLAETTPDPLVALLMHLVLEDEVRHHQLVERMSARLRDSLEWTHSPQALPAGGEAPDAATAEALAAVQGFLHHEQEGARHLRQLAKQSSDLYSGLFELLLDSMARDSEKHARILEFVRRRLAQRHA
jgi:rubrerythrin